MPLARPGRRSRTEPAGIGSIGGHWGRSRFPRDFAALMPKNAFLSAESLPQRRRGCRHDGYRPDPVAELPRPVLPQRRHLRNDGGGPRPSDRRRCRPPPARLSTSPASRRSASPEWRWRRSSATTSRSRPSCWTMAVSARACPRSRTTDVRHEAQHADLRRPLRSDEESLGRQGLPCLSVENPKDIRGALAEAMNSRSPALVNV
jgi:hypothetical protein